MNPLVSIIIPTFNRAHLIGETLDSILAQTYTNWECIVVDDGSTDETDALLAAYCAKDKRFQYHHRPKDRPKGANACRNYGFELCKGEFVNWFDDDDIMLGLFLEKKINFFKEDLNLVICSGYYVDEKLQNEEEIILEPNVNLFKEYVLWNLHILTPSILFKKQYLIGKELFSHKIVRGQETELFSRLFFKLPINSYKILNKSLFLYRQHRDTKSEKNNGYNKKFKESQSFISIENFKRSLQLKDNELIYHCYKNLIEFFFRGIEKGHLENSKYILENLITILKKVNKWVSFKLFIFGNLFLVIKRGSYNIEKQIKLYKFI